MNQNGQWSNSPTDCAAYSRRQRQALAFKVGHENDGRNGKVRNNRTPSAPPNMADCDWIILCDYAFPAQHGKLCLIGIFDTLFAKQVPVTHPRSAIGFSIIGEPGEHVASKLEIISPTGEVLSKAEMAFDLPDQGSAFIHIDVYGLTLKDFGRHALQMDLGDGHPKSAWFTLRKIEG